MLMIDNPRIERVGTGDVRALDGASIAILNWRDKDHPKAGAAEQYAWSMARRWAAAGANVTYVTARHKGAKRKEVNDRVRIVGAGGEFGVFVIPVSPLDRDAEGQR